VRRWCASVVVITLPIYFQTLDLGMGIPRLAIIQIFRSRVMRVTVDDLLCDVFSVRRSRRNLQVREIICKSALWLTF
jgi:hypothetical protein